MLFTISPIPFCQHNGENFFDHRNFDKNIFFVSINFSYKEDVFQVSTFCRMTSQILFQTHLNGFNFSRRQLTQCVSFKREMESVQNCIAQKEIVSSFQDLNIIGPALNCCRSEPFLAQRLKGFDFSEVFLEARAQRWLRLFFFT